MSHLVIHCGGPKTGSSALQYTLGTSGEALAAAGLDYPLVTDETDPSRPSTGNASSIPRQWKEFEPSETGRNIFEERTEALLARLAATPPATTVVYSSEYFSDLTGEEWSRVFDLLAPYGRAIAAVTYFRRQVDQVASIFGQFVKDGHRPPPDGFVAYSLAERLCLGPHAFHDRLRPLPFAAVEIAPYDRPALAGGDITADFLARVERLTGTRAPALATSREVNPSFNADALRLKHALNLAEPSIRENYAILFVLERVPQFRPGARGAQMVLPEREVRRIEEHFAEDNRRAVEAFGEAFAFLLRPAPAAMEFVDVTVPPSEAVRGLFWSAWRRVLADASPARRTVMEALEPRLVAALREAGQPGRA